jgi:hypothetical protein
MHLQHVSKALLEEHYLSEQQQSVEFLEFVGGL